MTAKTPGLLERNKGHQAAYSFYKSRMDLYVEQFRWPLQDAHLQARKDLSQAFEFGGESVYSAS
jgi:hypothetical protein